MNWFDRRMRVRCGLALRKLRGFAIAVGILAAVISGAEAQQVQCEHGVIQLPFNVNGTMEICSALAAQVPGLSRQLADITKSLGAQQDQLREINRLIKGLNSVSQNIGPQRQADMLRNFSLQLAASQKAGQQQTQQDIAALADKFDGLKDELLGLLTNKATADKANAAVEGPVGDAIAKLDLTTAHDLLEDIRAQLKAIHSEVGEVNERTKEIQSMLEEQEMTVGNVRSALMTVNVSALRKLSKRGIRPSIIEEAFRQKAEGGTTTVARRFFENSIDSSEALAWFDSALAAGVDPNMTLPGAYYEREGILMIAMRAGNVDAAKVLLRRGASPHPYQDLFLTRFTETGFLFPLQYIAEDDRFSLQQKQDLAKAFVEAGVVFPKVLPPKGNDWNSIMYQAKGQQDEVLTKLGMKLQPSATLCERPINPICKHASDQSGDNWCSAIAVMPKKLTFVFGDHSTSPLYDVELLYELRVEPSKAYFLGVIDHFGPEYVLVEVSRDGSSWTVMRYMPPESGMGLCRKDTDGDTYRAEYCWRRIPLRRVAGTDQMRFDEWGLTWKMVNNSCSSVPAK
jgi:archaellum component FlaC